MGQIPEFLHGKPFDEYMSKKDECIGNLGDSYYDKLIGGVECNPVELSKTVIIKYLLSKYNPITGEGLDCIYNQRPFVGVNDDNYNTEDKLNDTTHLQIFTSYLNAICAVQDPITKIIIKTIPMGIELFSLANTDGTVEFSIDGGSTYDNSVEVTGGETVYIKAAQADCGAVCGASAYEIWLAQGNSGDEEAFLDSLVGPQGPAGSNANIAGLTWKGSWSSSPSPAYAVNDAVQYSGTSYVKIGTGGNASLPPNDVANLNISWQVLALQGATGPAGANGSNGTNGAPGTNGASGVGGFRTLNASTTAWTLLATHALGTSGLTIGGTQATTTLTTDCGAFITTAATTAFTLTLPATLANFPVGYQVTIMQLQSGQVQISTTGGSTVVSANGMRYLRTQNSAATLIKSSVGNGTTTFDSWYLFGDLTNVVAP
jgi:hypothetical protein